MKLLKGLGIALVLFYAWVFIAVNFVTVGVDSKDTKQESTQRRDDIDLKANFEDAEILSKFYNDKGYFIVVYNATTKATEVFQVDYNEWEFMHIGELY